MVIEQNGAHKPTPVVPLESDALKLDLNLNAVQARGYAGAVHDYAEAASRLCSAAAGFVPEAGLRKGRTSAGIGARRSTLPITGRSGAPAADKDTNLFSLHRRSINRRSHGRSTCCGREKKFRNVQIRYARWIRFGCTYRGPIGVSSATTPSVSFSIHMSYLPGKGASTPPPLLKRAIIAPQMGHWEAIFLSLRRNYLRWINLRKTVLRRAGFDPAQPTVS